MFIRKNRTAQNDGAQNDGSAQSDNAAAGSTREESVGVGALVVVTGTGTATATATGTAPGDSGWVGEPTGVVIAPGDNEMAGYPGLAPGGPISWLIAFAEPAYKVGNAVPFDEATVAARFVTLLPTDEA